MSAPTADLVRPGTPRHTYLERGWWRTDTFLDDLRRQARERPRKLAIAARRLKESRTDTLDYAELARLTDRFAGALLDLGVRRGDAVAVQLPNRWELVALMFATIRVGAVIVPISPVCPEDELNAPWRAAAERLFANWLAIVAKRPSARREATIAVRTVRRPAAQVEPREL